MSRIYKFTLLALFTLLYSCNTIRENNDHCGFYLQFVYDYNMTYECLFKEQVPSVTVYVFDENETLLFERHELQANLIDGNRIYFNEGINSGNYKILTVAGLCEHYSVVDDSGSSCSPGVTTLSDVKLALNRNESVVSHQFESPLWLGEVVAAVYPGGDHTIKVSLVKETNHFTVTLYSTQTGTRANELAYTAQIVAPEGGVYAYDNTPLARETVAYYPYSESAGSEENATVVDCLNTMRLFDGDADGYQLNVIEKATGTVVFSYDLIALLQASKPNAPDDSPLDMQEYLDREYEWEIGLTYDDATSSFIAINLIINGWIVWLRDIEL